MKASAAGEMPTANLFFFEGGLSFAHTLDGGRKEILYFDVFVLGNLTEKSTGETATPSGE